MLTSILNRSCISSRGTSFHPISSYAVDLIQLIGSFYDVGHADGFAHGRIHGLIEGRALGREKGFEMWEELGFYEGFARVWASLLAKQGRVDERAHQHCVQLLSLISRFPRANPSPDDPADISRLLRQIRSRYKASCAALGVRPSMRAAEAESSPPPPGTDGRDMQMQMETEDPVEVSSVWKLEVQPKRQLPPGSDLEY